MEPKPTHPVDLSKRAERSDLESDHRSITADPSIKPILDALPEAVMILNTSRQIVFTNQACQQMIGASEEAEVCGLRPGEALLCSHAEETKNGCGTSDFCTYCGAHIAILLSQIHGSETRECRITRKDTGLAIDLNVKAGAFHFNDKPYTIFSLLDISKEKRNEFLQRIFFHDILNTAGGLSGYAQLLLNTPEHKAREFKEIIHDLSVRLIDEIHGQKQLIAAENGTLQPFFKEVSSLEILKGVIQVCKAMQEADNKEIILKKPVDPVYFQSDPSLLSRVLVNLIKNALEASQDGQPVTVGSKGTGNQVVFFVNNRSVMPAAIKFQIFQRSFSTKGLGRGLGTYSVKLLTERFLKGDVHFESSESSGTSFFITFPIKLETG